MRRIRFLLAALLAACALPTGGGDAKVSYDVDRASYGRHETISTALVNTSGEDAGYNLCVSVLEKRAGGGFRRVERTPEHPCALMLFTLHPGETATYTEPASVFPGPGTYRLRTTVEAPISGRRFSVVTDPFVVE
ncbi:MAG TPA: hypothetical protein VFR37_22960 [Longimicrobium sp.]|nr:hypothetical protein [Longimicrobium sp.]